MSSDLLDYLGGYGPSTLQEDKHTRFKLSRYKQSDNSERVRYVNGALERSIVWFVQNNNKHTDFVRHLDFGENGGKGNCPTNWEQFCHMENTLQNGLDEGRPLEYCQWE